MASRRARRRPRAARAEQPARPRRHRDVEQPEGQPVRIKPSCGTSSSGKASATSQRAEVVKVSTCETRS